MSGELIERARLTNPIPGGGFKYCTYPCQKLDAHGNRAQRECRVPVDPRYGGKSWQATGPADAPTLTPSIDCQSKPCWHGHIIEGTLHNAE